MKKQVFLVVLIIALLSALAMGCSGGDVSTPKDDIDIDIDLPLADGDNTDADKEINESSEIVETDGDKVETETDAEVEDVVEGEVEEDVADSSETEETSSCEECADVVGRYCLESGESIMSEVFSDSYFEISATEDSCEFLIAFYKDSSEETPLATDSFNGCSNFSGAIPYQDQQIEYTATIDM